MEYHLHYATIIVVLCKQLSTRVVTVAEYIYKLQTVGRYSVTTDELNHKLSISPKAILQGVHRLVSKGKLVMIRQGFYVIITPTYTHLKILPTTLFIDQLMRYLDRPYYVGLYSAASLHGAGHQQPMATQVIIRKPSLRSINKTNLSLKWFVKNSWQERATQQLKSDSGYFQVSTPATTLLDLTAYHKRIGGLNRILPIAHELCEEIHPDDLTLSVSDYPTAVVRRTGYLLEHLGLAHLAGPCYNYASQFRMKESRLSLSHDDYDTPIDDRWNLYMNTSLDTL